MQQVLSAQCALFRGVPSLLFLFPVFGGYGKYTRCMRRRNNQRGESHSLVYKCFHAAFPFYPCGRNHFFKGASFFVSSRSCFLPGMQLYARSQRMSKDRNALPSIPVSVQLVARPRSPPAAAAAAHSFLVVACNSNDPVM